MYSDIFSVTNSVSTRFLSRFKMATIGVGSRRGAKNTDYDAAQALLDLQSNINITPTPFTAGWRDTESKEDIEKAAKLILSCFIASDVPENNVVHKSKKNTHFPITPERLRKYASCNSDPKKCKADHQFLSHGRISNRNTSTPINKQYGKEIFYEKKTCDAGTQTEDNYFNPNITLMESTIKNLCDRIKALEAQIKNSLDQSMDEASFETTERDLSLSYENNEEDPDFQMNLDYTDTNEPKHSRTSGFDNSASNDSRIRQTNRNVVYNAVVSNNNTNSNDLVPIGDGNATVPSRLLKHINWNSYSSATRKLLTAVFSRRILATHSLTGKPSPAFPNKPAKKKLDPKLVHDIVQTVIERCRVPENVVRTSITTKCADESKMFRTREKNKKKRSSKKNRENVPPTTSDSESDDY